MLCKFFRSMAKCYLKTLDLYTLLCKEIRFDNRADTNFYNIYIYIYIIDDKVEIRIPINFGVKNSGLF